MINKSYADFSWEQAAALLAIDSPTGFTHMAAAWVKEAFEALGFAATITTTRVKTSSASYILTPTGRQASSTERRSDSDAVIMN